MVDINELNKEEGLDLINQITNKLNLTKKEVSESFNSSTIGGGGG